MDTITSFLKSFGFILLDSILTTIACSILHNDALGYLVSTIIMLILFFLLYKERLITDLKNIKKNTKISYIFISLLFIILCYIFNLLFVNLLDTAAYNEISIENILFKYPLIFVPNIVLLAPLKEEIMYRMQYKKNLSSIIISTLVFALCHVYITDLSQLTFFVPYLLLSISFSYAYFKSNNIVLSTIIHILNNSLNIVLLFI